MENEQGLFDEIRFTDRGRKYIRTLVRASMAQMGLFILYFAIIIIYEIWIMSNDRFKDLPMNYQVASYIHILFSIIALVGNSYYLRFPIKLMTRLESRDEAGVNMSFGFFLKGVVLGIIYYLGMISFMIWRVSWDPWL